MTEKCLPSHWVAYEQRFTVSPDRNTTVTVICSLDCDLVKGRRPCACVFASVQNVSFKWQISFQDQFFHFYMR